MTKHTIARVGNTDEEIREVGRPGEEVIIQELGAVYTFMLLASVAFHILDHCSNTNHVCNVCVHSVQEIAKL
jgi:hypothetical protein